MPRARKRDWQPKGLEIFDTSDLILDEALISVITQRFGSSHSQKKLEQLQKSLRWTAGRLRAPCTTVLGQHPEKYQPG
jgi:hypothetical protein